MREQAAKIMARIYRDIKKCYPALLGLCVYWITVHLAFHTFCPQMILIGIPCAGCGLTRASFYILTGRFLKGIQMHPAAPLWIAYLAWLLWMRYVRGIVPKRAGFWIAVICVATLGIYVYRMCVFFPGDPPMAYYRHNLFYHTFAL